MRGGGDERRARRARGDDVLDGRILGMTPTRRRGAGLRAERREVDKPLLMLRNALVLLPRVLHVLELDQDLGCGLDGGGERGSRRVASRAALLALAPPPPVLAEASSPALARTLRTLPPVLAEASSPALLAPSLPPVLADARPRTPSQCSQMPPHSLHSLLPPVLADARPRTPCTSFAHAFATSRARRCSSPALLALASLPPVLADAPPPHSLHALRTLPCSQMPEPPHSLHLLRSLPCSQIPFPGHSLQRYPPQPTPCTHALPVVCTPTSRGRFPSAGAMSARAVGRDARSRRRAPGDAGTNKSRRIFSREPRQTTLMTRRDGTLVALFRAFALGLAETPPRAPARVSTPRAATSRWPRPARPARASPSATPPVGPRARTPTRRRRPVSRSPPRPLISGTPTVVVATPPPPPPSRATSPPRAPIPNNPRPPRTSPRS